MSTGALKDYDYVGFSDADLATPLWEVSNMLQYKDIFLPEAESIWASRVYRLGSHIKTFKAEALSRAIFCYNNR